MFFLANRPLPNLVFHVRVRWWWHRWRPGQPCHYHIMGSQECRTAAAPPPASHLHLHTQHQPATALFLAQKGSEMYRILPLSISIDYRTGSIPPTLKHFTVRWRFSSELDRVRTTWTLWSYLEAEVFWCPNPHFLNIFSGWQILSGLPLAPVKD